ncbi:hypothetical protein [Chryseobacterium vrystaatense]|uniref:Uncharacterized protein n=1 Tax=Chryseobacterium vrystaatense TaxID=307480 RepID=A0A1M5PA91_9FLAO|nr:hypothetical protein [Chryseobacterium vrystaatense]KFF24608.1 hypothetical protein IW16_20035 [Chryseobacterium vrystaatense]SHG98662.1 hypothetical protein SAMN02787073_0024 [Chryseobacterium vrystaatense]
MKKFLTIAATAAAALVYSQGTLIINNYSKFDYNGFMIAGNSTVGCYPRVANEAAIVVPADSHMGNGKNLMYKDYQNQYYSLYPTTNWSVYPNANTTSVMAWDNVNLAPGGTISTTTQWYATKFYTTFPGTNTSNPEFQTNLVLPNPCNSGSSTSFSTASGNNSADIFVIGGITYLQLY